MASNPDHLRLEDIARLAGVGLGTASRALNNSPGVSAATRKKVLRVAAEHSYVVSPSAANLAGAPTRRVALVVPHLSRWFFGQMVEALVSEFADAELDVLLYHVGGLEDRRRFFEHLPARRKVDAVVVVAFPVEDAERERLELLGVQVVAAGGQHAEYPHVCIDDEAAGRQAMDHLLALGHRSIGTIEAVDPDQAEEPSGRSRAYDSAMSEAGLPIDARMRVTTDWGGEQGAAAMGRLLSVPRPPTAVYAHSDEVALGAMRTIRRAGLRVPEDISVIGIDDHPLAELTDLTTIRQPVAEQGRQTARLLLDLLKDPAGACDRAVMLPTELVVRGTTAPPRAAR